MNLLFLSLTRLHPHNPQPHVPTNADRLRALRYVLTPVIGNTHPWPWKIERRHVA